MAADWTHAMLTTAWQCGAHVPRRSLELNCFNTFSKFNPSLYGPSILSPRGKPGIMQNFINNKGKVNAFKLPDRDTVVTLRKPQVYKVNKMNIQEERM